MSTRDPASPLHCVSNGEVITNINRVLSAAGAAGDLVFHVWHVHRADGSNVGRLFDFSSEPGELGFVAGTEEVEDGSRLKIPSAALADRGILWR